MANKTQPTSADVDAFLAAVDPETRRRDAQELNRLFRDVTGWAPRVWGTSIIGYGRYSYAYASGRSGEFLATGFAARKSSLAIYIMPGYEDFEDLLARLGPHKRGKACLNIARLSDVDRDVLADLIDAGLESLKARWPVFAE